MKLDRIAEGYELCVLFQSDRSQRIEFVFTTKRTVEHDGGITSKQYVRVYNDYML